MLTVCVLLFLKRDMLELIALKLISILKKLNNDNDDNIHVKFSCKL